MELGKSFYTKLLILRYKLLGMKQYIIDPEREYNNLCETLNGTQIRIGPTSNTYINILDIRKESVEDGRIAHIANNQLQQAGNYIGAEGARARSEALKTNTTLQSLNLWGEQEESEDDG